MKEMRFELCVKGFGKMGLIPLWHNKSRLNQSPSTGRVPTVMESHGKICGHGKSWKIKISKVMEKLKFYPNSCSKCSPEILYMSKLSSDEFHSKNLQESQLRKWSWKIQNFTLIRNYNIISSILVSEIVQK